MRRKTRTHKAVALELRDERKLLEAPTVFPEEKLALPISDALAGFSRARG